MEYKYDAFISYKHTKQDIKVAKKLLYSLEYYYIPRKIRKETGKKKINRIFRDKEELQVTNDLNEEIVENLKKSRFLIVICSPEAKKSTWVIREIESFIKSHNNSKKDILTVLSKGEPEDAIPKILMNNEKVTSNLNDRIVHTPHSTEPLSADYRNEVGWLNRIIYELPRIVSTIIKCDYYNLLQRKQKIRTLLVIILFIFMIMVFAIIIKVNNDIKQNRENAMMEQQKVIALQAEEAFDSGKRLNSINNIISAADIGSEMNLLTPQLERVLQKVTNAYIPEGNGNLIVSQELKTEKAIAKYYIDEYTNGKYVATVELDGKIVFWNSKTGENIISLEFKNADRFTGKDVEDMIGIAFRKDAHSIILYDNTVVCCNLEIGKIDWERRYNWHYTGFTFEMKSERYRDTNELFSLHDESYGTNGSYIALWIPEKIEGYSNEEKNDFATIVLLDMEDGEQIDFLPIKYEASTIKISEDGRYIAFSERDDGDNNWKGYLFDRASREKLELTEHNPHDIVFIKDKLLMLHSIQRKTNSNFDYSPDTSIECFSLSLKNKLWEHTYSIEYDAWAKKPWIKIPSSDWVSNTYSNNFFALINGNEVFLCNLNQGFVNQRASFPSFVKDIHIDLEYQNENVLYAVLESGDLYRYMIERYSGEYIPNAENLNRKYFFARDIVKANYIHSTYYVICKEDNFNKSEDIGVLPRGMNSFRMLIFRKEGYDKNVRYFAKQVSGSEGKIIPFEDDFFYIDDSKNGHSNYYFIDDKYTDIKLDNKYNRIDCFNTKIGNISWMSESNFSISEGDLLSFVGILPQKNLLVLYHYNQDNLDGVKYLYFISTVNGSLYFSKNLKTASINGKRISLCNIKPFIQNGTVRLMQKKDKCLNIIQYNFERDDFSLLFDSIYCCNSDIVLEESISSPDGNSLLYIFYYYVKTKNGMYLENEGLFINLKNGKCKSIKNDLLDTMHLDNCYWNISGSKMVTIYDNTVTIFSVSGNIDCQIKCANINPESWAINETQVIALCSEENDVVLYRYSSDTGQFLGKTILFEKNSHLDYDTIEILDSGDDLIMLKIYIKNIENHFSKIYIIDPNNGEVITYIDGGISYSKESKIFVISDKNSNYGYVKRYSFDELKEKAKSKQKKQDTRNHIVISNNKFK